MRANQHDARMLSPQAKEVLRLRVVHAVVEQQMRPMEAVRVFRVSRTAVFGWVRAYRAGGVRSLRAHALGRPRRSRLAAHRRRSRIDAYLRPLDAHLHSRCHPERQRRVFF